MSDDPDYEWPNIPNASLGAGIGGDLDRSAIAIAIVFGAVIICGLMAASLVYKQRDGFLFALGAATAAWFAGHAMLFDMPRVYGVLIVISALMAGASTITLVT
jgi:hypothetical protein